MFLDKRHLAIINLVPDRNRNVKLKSILFGEFSRDVRFSTTVIYNYSTLLQSLMCAGGMPVHISLEFRKPALRLPIAEYSSILIVKLDYIR